MYLKLLNFKQYKFIELSMLKIILQYNQAIKSLHSYKCALTLIFILHFYI